MSCRLRSITVSSAGSLRVGSRPDGRSPRAGRSGGGIPSAVFLSSQRFFAMRDVPTARAHPLTLTWVAELGSPKFQGGPVRRRPFMTLQTPLCFVELIASDTRSDDASLSYHHIELQTHRGGKTTKPSDYVSIPSPMEDL